MVDDENVKLCLLTTQREWAGITKISREGDLPIWLLHHFVLSTGSHQVFEIVCYKRSSEEARVSFRHTFQFSSSFQSSPSSQVLEDPELKGRCGDLWNERFVPSSDTTVQILEQNFFGRVIFPQNFTEMKITKQQTSCRKILYQMHGSSFTAHLKFPIQEEKKNRKRKDWGNLPHTACVRGRISVSYFCPPLGQTPERQLQINTGFSEISAWSLESQAAQQPGFPARWFDQILLMPTPPDR
jgi:hypothetical protein